MTKKSLFTALEDEVIEDVINDPTEDSLTESI